MALPQDGQNANGLTKVTEIPKGKELIFIDPATNEGGIITLEDLTTQILNKLTSKIFTLDQGNMTLLAALNQLNSNAQKIRFNGNIKNVAFRSGGNGLKNIYIDFFQADNSRSTLAFFTDGENAIGFYDGDTKIWKLTVK